MSGVFLRKKVPAVEKTAGTSCFLQRLHGAAGGLGDGALKNAGGVTVKGLQAGGGQVAGDVAVHGQVHVENELDLGILLGARGLVLHAAGAGVDLGAAAVVQLEQQIAGAVEEVLLDGVRLAQGADIGRRDQLRPLAVLQS